jgi:hypothetical protein
MQQTSQSSAASVEVVRRSNCTILLLLCFPLLAACTVTGGVRAYESRSHTMQTNRRLGTLKESQAEALARTLCTKITGAPADVLDVSGFANNADEEEKSAKCWNEWQIQCRAGSSRYLLRLDANRREVLVIQREHGDGGIAPRGSETAEAPQNGENGDLPAGRLSRREAQRWAEHYLSLVGLPLPASARLIRVREGYDFLYQCDDSDGSSTRQIRVRVDLKDGSLDHLQNVLYRKYASRSPIPSAP